MDSANNLDYELVREQLKQYKDDKSKEAKKQYIEKVFTEKDNYTKTLKSSLKKSMRTAPSLETDDEKLFKALTIMM